MVRFQNKKEEFPWDDSKVEYQLLVHNLSYSQYSTAAFSIYLSPVIKTTQNFISGPGISNFMAGKYFCMVMRLNIDCNGCCRKVRRILLNMKEIETHLIEKQQCRVSVCGRFVPADVAIKMRKKMNRRVEILEIQELDGTTEQMEQRAMIATCKTHQLYC